MKNNWPRKGMIVGIIIVLVGANVVSALNRNVTLDSSPLSQGNTLYVGGSGPGNYSRIQDAVNATYDGDTVFVFSGVYCENVRINTSIKLIGENRETTILDCNQYLRNQSAIIIQKDYVTVSGFTIQNRKSSSDSYKGVGIALDDAYKIWIADNSFINDNVGIDTSYYGSNIIISKNHFDNTTYGILTEYADKIIIIDNHIRNSETGIIAGGRNIIIRNNVISSCSVGIEGYLCQLYISRNDISNCSTYGIFLSESFLNVISCNNFIDNACPISFEYDDLMKFIFLVTLHPFQMNKFFFNFYDDHSSRMPKVIKGTMAFYVSGRHPGEYEYRDWYNFDWFPAQKPYNSGG
jgi:hypothetical protein